jgi:hypothetical protein
MTRKNIQIIVILIIGIIAGFLGGYLFRQSAKLKQVSKPAVVKQGRLKQEITSHNKVEEKGKIFKKDVFVKASKNQVVEKGSEEREETQSARLKKWIDEYVITPYFIQDLVSFILDSYQPAMTKENPNKSPVLNISLKAINARYGLELIGFKVQATSIERARKEILHQIMDTEILKQQYEHYSDIFIEELIDQAGEVTKDFLVDGKLKERELNKGEIRDLLLLLSDYVLDLSKILQTISRNKILLDKLKGFLKAEESSMHNNYVLNQVINKYNLEKQRLKKIGNGPLDEKLKRLERERERAIKNYEFSIKRREQLRKEIISYILKKNPDVKFSTSEILYICEWVHRRIQEGKKLSDILEIGNILEQVSLKLEAKAKELF